MNIHNLLSSTSSLDQSNLIEEYLISNSSEPSTTRIIALSQSRLEGQHLTSPSNLGSLTSVNTVAERTVQPLNISNKTRGIKRKRLEPQEFENCQRLVIEILDHLKKIEENYTNYKQETKIKVCEELKEKLSSSILLKQKCLSAKGYRKIKNESIPSSKLTELFPKMFKRRIQANLKKIQKIGAFLNQEVKVGIIAELDAMKASFAILSESSLTRTSKYILAQQSKKQRIEHRPLLGESEEADNRKKSIPIPLCRMAWQPPQDQNFPGSIFKVTLDNNNCTHVLYAFKNSQLRKFTGRTFENKRAIFSSSERSIVQIDPTTYSHPSTHSFSESLLCVIYKEQSKIEGYRENGFLDKPCFSLDYSKNPDIITTTFVYKNHMLVGFENGTAWLQSIQDGSEPKILQGPKSHVTALTMNNQYIAIGYSKTGVRVYDTSSLNQSFAGVQHYHTGIIDLLICESTLYIATKNSIEIYNLNKEEREITLTKIANRRFFDEIVQISLINHSLYVATKTKIYHSTLPVSDESWEEFWVSETGNITSISASESQLSVGTDWGMLTYFLKK